MLIIVTYDICVKDFKGKKRLRTVAKFCERYGIRAQNSVFEMLLDYTEFQQVRAELESMINKETDLLKFYSLGNNWKGKIYQEGVMDDIEQNGTLII